MKNIKSLFLLFISITFYNNTFCQPVSTCLDTLSGIKHSHILSILDCNTSINITSTVEEPITIISGVVISSGSISITSGETKTRIVPADHSEDDPLIQYRRTHSSTHLKVRPPSSVTGRFMAFKNKQTKLVFPNPAKDKITINSTNTLKSIIIYNLYGNEVVKENNPNKKNEKPTIDITQLDNGFYTIKLLYTNGLTKTETLIKN